MNSFEKKIELLCKKQNEDLEPKSHCCECTKGDNYDPFHQIHIQYKNCNCKKENYVLKNN